jgi:hypothetical protein
MPAPTGLRRGRNSSLVAAAIAPFSGGVDACRHARGRKLEGGSNAPPSVPLGGTSERAPSIDVNVRGSRVEMRRKGAEAPFPRVDLNANP